MPDKELTPDEIKQNRRMLAHLPAWLKLRGIKQVSLATKMATSEATVSKWLSGKQSMTVAQFLQIAAILEAGPSELLTSPQGAERSRRYEALARAAQALDPHELDALITVAQSMQRQERKVSSDEI